MSHIPSTPARIGYVVKRYPRFSETFIVNEILAHEETGRQIDIFALRRVEESHFQDILARVRAPVTRVPDHLRSAETFWQLLRGASDLPGFADLVTRFPEAKGDDIAQALFIATQVRARGIDHLHAHFGTIAATVARIAAALAGISWSVTLHAKDIYCQYEENQNLDLKLRDADAVVTVSDFNVDHLTHTYPGTQPLRIHNGLDLDRFTWRAPQPDALEILAVGRLVEKKGFHILIEALRIVSAQGHPVQARIIGAGEEEADLRAQIAACGLSGQVALDGPVPQERIRARMQAAAMLVCPCVVGEDGNRDGMPTVLIEAMALGLPCIGSDVTGIPELIGDGDTGLIAPEGDAPALARAITRLLADPALRARLSQAARARVERDYDIRRNVPALGAVFDRCAGRAATERGAA